MTEDSRCLTCSSMPPDGTAPPIRLPSISTTMPRQRVHPRKAASATVASSVRSQAHGSACLRRLRFARGPRTTSQHTAGRNALQVNARQSLSSEVKVCSLPSPGHPGSLEARGTQLQAAMRKLRAWISTLSLSALGQVMMTAAE